MNLPKELIVTISGARGIAPEILSPEVAYTLAAAFAAICPPGPLVISRDSRASGVVLKRAILQALADNGREILDADLIPLPTTQLAVEHTGAAGAIDITASHNPAQYNGMKFLDSAGTFLTQDAVDTLLATVPLVSEPVTPTPYQVRDIQSQAVSWHINALTPLVPVGRTLKVAVDAVNGAGSYIVPEFLETIGCSVIPLATDPTQPFPHTPEPTPANLVWTQNQLQGKTYDLAVVVDPDSDRLVLIDEKGRLVDEEAAIPLVAEALLLQGKRGTIVVNLSTSRMIEDVAARYGAVVKRSAVGERNVVSMMQKEAACFGGEGCGGVIDPAVHMGRDGLVGIAHIVSLLRITNKPLSQLVDELPRYAMKKTKIPLTPETPLTAVYAKLKEYYTDAVVNEDDGLRLSWKTSWLHVRPSNTEPIVRLIAESESDERTNALLTLPQL